MINIMEPFFVKFCNGFKRQICHRWKLSTGLTLALSRLTLSLIQTVAGSALKARTKLNKASAVLAEGVANKTPTVACGRKCRSMLVCE